MDGKHQKESSRQKRTVIEYVLLGKDRHCNPRKGESALKDWIPDQVRNDTTCKVVSETLSEKKRTGSRTQIKIQKKLIDITAKGPEVERRMRG